MFSLKDWFMSRKKATKKELSQDEVKLIRCPDCPWKAGLKDANTICTTCEGSGTIEE